MQFRIPFSGKGVTHPEYATIEHIRDYSDTKNNNIKNLGLAHYRCNQAKSFILKTPGYITLNKYMKAIPIMQLDAALRILTIEELLK